MQQTILLPQSVLAEVAFMLTRAGGKSATVRFFRALPQSKYRPIALKAEDFIHAADILQKYQDTRVDFVDATIAAIAERLHIPTILTLDRRDFGLIRPAHVDFFALLPSP
jgi:predicted nucleic acid-binding protein